MIPQRCRPVTEERQKQDDINTIGLILEWRPLCIVPQHELNAMSSHLRDTPYNWSCTRVCEAVCAYRTCERVILQIMMLGCEGAK